MPVYTYGKPIPVPSWMRKERHGTKLTRKQVSALKRALARRGLKLPKVGWCTITTKEKGRYSRIVASSELSTSEVCHNMEGGKHVYRLNARPRSRR